jgi:hypothetical protein
MEMVKSLVAMVSKFSSEVQQAPSHVPSIRRKFASSVTANNATANSCRGVVLVCALGGEAGATVVTALATNFLPESSIVTAENSSDGDYVTIVRKKRVTPSPVHTSTVANTTTKYRMLTIRVRSSSSFPVVQKVCRKPLFASRVSPGVTTIDVEKSLQGQLQLTSSYLHQIKK